MQRIVVLWLGIIFTTSWSSEAFVVSRTPMTRTPPSALKGTLASIQDVVEKEKQSTKIYQYHVGFKNFWKSTRAHFLPCDFPRDRKPDFTSKKSEYWDVDDEYVIRKSDHWSNHCGNIKSCFWTIDEAVFEVPYKRSGGKKKKPKKTKHHRCVTGMCRYADFERGKSSSMKLRRNDRLTISSGGGE